MDGVNRELSEEPPASFLGGWIGGRVDVLGEWMVTKPVSHLWSQFPSLQTMNIKKSSPYTKKYQWESNGIMGKYSFQLLAVLCICQSYFMLLLLFISLVIWGMRSRGEKHDLSGGENANFKRRKWFYSACFVCYVDILKPRQALSGNSDYEKV